MTITPGLNREYQLEVAEYTDGTTPTTWSKVGGLTAYTPFSNEKGREEDTEFDSNGRVTEMGTTLTSELSGTVKISEKGISADPGQGILWTASGKTGSEGFVHWRETHKQTGEGHVGVADASYTPQGGEQAGFTTAEFALAIRSEEPYTAV